MFPCFVSMCCHFLILVQIPCFYFMCFHYMFFWLNLIQRPATTLGYRRAYSDDPKGCNLRSILTVAEDFVSIYYTYITTYIYIIYYTPGPYIIPKSGEYQSIVTIVVASHFFLNKCSPRTFGKIRSHFDDF